MVENNGAPLIDEIKVRAVCDDLHVLSPDDPQYAVVLRCLDEHWRLLSSVEQDEIDRIFGQRGLVRLK
jgi:hypothetical protein